MGPLLPDFGSRSRAAGTLRRVSFGAGSCGGRPAEMLEDRVEILWSAWPGEPLLRGVLPYSQLGTREGREVLQRATVIAAGPGFGTVSSAPASQSGGAPMDWAAVDEMDWGGGPRIAAPGDGSPTPVSPSLPPPRPFPAEVLDWARRRGRTLLLLVPPAQRGSDDPSSPAPKPDLDRARGVALLEALTGRAVETTERAVPSGADIRRRDAVDRAWLQGLLPFLALDGLGFGDPSSKRVRAAALETFGIRRGHEVRNISAFSPRGCGTVGGHVFRGSIGAGRFLVLAVHRPRGDDDVEGLRTALRAMARGFGTLKAGIPLAGMPWEFDPVPTSLRDEGLTCTVRVPARGAKDCRLPGRLARFLHLVYSKEGALATHSELWDALGRTGEPEPLRINREKLELVKTLRDRRQCGVDPPWLRKHFVAASSGQGEAKVLGYRLVRTDEAADA